MKTNHLSAIAVATAASLALAMPAFADDAHHPEGPGAAKPAQTQPDTKTSTTVQDTKTVQKMQDNLGRMRAQLERLAKAKSADERQKVMNEHLLTMQENMGMARGMQSGMMGCPMMQGGDMGMMGGNGDMMAKRMEMMEKRMDMMQMMMSGGMGSQPGGQPAKPAKSAN